jgi:hypothetical protein
MVEDVQTFPLAFVLRRYFASGVAQSVAVWTPGSVGRSLEEMQKCTLALMLRRSPMSDGPWRCRGYTSVCPPGAVLAISASEGHTSV